jgi:hypothetical protein
VNNNEFEISASLTKELAALRQQWVFINRQDTEVLVLSEEYKIRWQQVLDLDGEINRWTASYVIALVVGISWIMGSDRIGEIQQIYSGRNYDNCYFVLSLALINAAYSLSLTFKGYQIQQLRLYLYREVCTPLTRLAHTKSKLWETWHRTEFSKGREGKPEWRRSLYYLIITLLPFAVSASILGTYVYHAGIGLKLWDLRNIFFYIVIFINMAALLLSISTLGFNKLWEEEVKKAKKDSEEETNKRHENRQENSVEPTSQVKRLQENAIRPVATRLDETRTKTRNSSWVISIVGLSMVAGNLIRAFRTKANRQ